MRLTGGELRGRKLAVPQGRSVRPTADRVREALFNVLAHAAWASSLELVGCQVVDVFAGSGALGFEALSRGAEHAIFLERDRVAREAIRANAEQLGVAARISVRDRGAARPGLAAAPCQLAFLDPPYRHDLAGAALAALRVNGWFAAAALAVVELAANEAFKPPPGFVSVDERRYGATRLVFLRHATPSPSG